MRRSTKRQVRYGVVGLGYIAQTAVLPAFKHARSNSRLNALISTDSAKLKRLGRKYNVDNLYSFQNVEECLQSGDIDALYIATPNDQHKDLVELAAHHGVHVLCEKPLAVNESDCQSMIEVAASSGIKFMVGYRLHFETANLHVLRQARSRKLGGLKIFNSVFSTQVRDRENIRLRAPEAGGGPLYDIGIYCINAARTLFRAEPEEVFAIAGGGGDSRFKNADEMVSATLKFPDGQLASFVCSFGAGDSSAFDIIGTKGRIHIENAYDYAMPMNVSTFKDDRVSKRKFGKKDQFGPELVYFSNCVLENKRPEPSGLEGLADVRVIRALQQSIEQKTSVMLNRQDAPVKAKWANPGQKIERPAIPRQPPLFHAKQPGRP